jgi:hypothetical protein
MQWRDDSPVVDLKDAVQIWQATGSGSSTRIFFWYRFILVLPFSLNSFLSLHLLVCFSYEKDITAMVNQLRYKSTTDHGRCSRRVFAMDLWVPVGDAVVTDLGWDVRWFEASFWFYGSSCRILLVHTFRCWSLFMVLVFVSDLKIILSSALCDQAS